MKFSSESVIKSFKDSGLSNGNFAKKLKVYERLSPFEIKPQTLSEA